MALSKIIENSLADEAVSSAKLKDFAAAVDLNGVELVLDADADTSITADTDDRIDFKIANVEHFSFSNSSGDTIIKPMVDAKDIKFQQFDGRTLLDINDGGFVGIANGATSSGEIRFFEDTDNGSNYVGLNAGSISSSFTLTLPTADGSSGQFLKTDGSGALSFDTVSSAADDLTTGDAAVTLATSAGNITIDAQGGDTDIIFKGTDGSSDITPMTLDMSDAGALLLTGGKIDLKNSGTRSKILFYCESGNAHAQTLQAAPHSESASNTLTLPSTGGDVDLVSTASTATLTNKTLTTPKIAEIDSLSSGSITLDAEADIVLDADGADIIFKDAGTSILTITNNSTDVDFTVATQDKDINFKGDDGGSGITALSLDMSDAGTAVFNHDIRIADGGQIGSASDADAITIGSDGDVTFTQDLELQHDGATLSFGANDEIALTHVHDTGLLLTDSGGTPTLQLHDANESIASDGSKVIITSGGTAFSLPTSDGSNGQVLKTNGSGVLSFGADSGGKILQVVSTTFTGTESSTSNAANNTFTNTSISAQITPSASSSKIFISALANVGGTNHTDGSPVVVLRRDSTNILIGDDAGDNKQRASTGRLNDMIGSGSIFPIHLSVVDSPNSTSAITYRVALGIRGNGSGTAYINRSGDDSNNIENFRAASSITLFEIDGS